LGLPQPLGCDQNDGSCLYDFQNLNPINFQAVAEMTGARRVPALDGLRGIAALSVMAFHFNIFFLPQAGLSKFVPFLNRAYLAVDLFFLLSGFVMAHVYGHQLAGDWRAHWRGFALARFVRLYPLFAITTLAMVVLVALYHTPAEGVSFSYGSLALQPLMLQQWSSDLSWNYPSWSISTEAEAYTFFVFFAGLLLVGKYPRLIAVCLILALAALSARNGGSINYFVGVRALLRTLAGFSLGVLVYRAYSLRTEEMCKWSGIVAVLLLGVSALIRIDFIAVCGFAFLIMYCAGATTLFSALLETRPLITLGNWSYSIYLWHVPVHCAVGAGFALSHHPVSQLNTLSARLLLLATVLAVVGLAAIHYRYVEIPIGHKLRLHLVL
jgi:peptidoglycan/LPS O-acetylase OafA/YrhL